MSNIFLCADHHLGHSNILTFTKNDGSKLRDFATIEEHDYHIVERHNSVVRPQDKVYFIGDVTMSHKHLYILERMNGTKVLIKGNHDLAKLSQYEPYFKDIRAYHQLNKFILSHIPIHPGSLPRWRGNIHGHLHSNVVTMDNKQPDKRFMCVSLEQLNDYTPISLEEASKHFDNQ